MFERRIACGSFVQTPLGPRKSGMPDSVLIPAPVSTTIRSAEATAVATRSIVDASVATTPILAGSRPCVTRGQRTR